MKRRRKEHSLNSGLDILKSPRSMQRTAVLVLGMHRSGTSALSRVLSLAGCDLPKTMMPPNADNEAGYWESPVVMRLNDKILASANSAWDDAAEFDPGWIHSPQADEFRRTALATLDDEFGFSPLFVLKDPRICRFPKFWMDVLTEFGARPAAMLQIRNPLEVSASLEARNGFDPGFSLLLWLRHVLDAEHSTRGIKRYFASYERLMSDPSFVFQEAGPLLDVDWPRQSAGVAEEIGSFLSDRLRHNREDSDRVVDNPALSSWIRESFAIFSRWTRSGEEPQDLETLDRIRREFNSVSPALSWLAAATRAATAKLSEQERKSATLQLKLDQATASGGGPAHPGAEGASAKALLAEANAKEQAAREEAISLRARLSQLETESEEQRRDIETSATRAADASARIERLALELEEEREAARRSRLEAEQSKSSLEEASRSLRSLSRRDEENTTKLLQARAEIQRLIKKNGLEEQVSKGLKDHVRLLIDDVTAGEESAKGLDLEVKALRARVERLQPTEDRLREVENQRDRLIETIGRQHDQIQRLETQTSREVEILRNYMAEAVGRQREQVQSLEEQLNREAALARSLASQLEVRNSAVIALQNAVESLLGQRGGPKWLARIRLHDPVKALRNAELVDPNWYLANYKDVAEAGMDPVGHYVLYGAAEGRQPNAVVATARLSTGASGEAGSVDGPGEVSATGPSS